MNTHELKELKAQYDQLKNILSDEEKKRIRQLLGLEPPDFIDWLKSEFYIPETKAPMELYGLQEAGIREAMKTDDDGKFIYSTIMWGDIKKSAKTAIGAARALWSAIHTDFAMVRVVGNDRDQAQSRLFYYIVRCLKLNHALTERTGARIQVSRNRIYFTNESYIEAIAVDPEGEAGGGDDVVVFTELWGAKTEAHIRLWTELTLSPLKYGFSQRWCESYAGVRGYSPLLETLYDRCVVEKDNEDVNDLGGRRVPGTYVNLKGEEKRAPFFTDKTGNIFCLWNRTPHVPWQTEAYYGNERATLLDHEFTRVHRNTFLESQQRYIDEVKLKSCYGEAPTLNERSVLVLASDAAYSNDSYGLVGVLYDPVTDIVELAVEYEWFAPEGQEIDLSLPEGVVRRLAAKHIVLVWAYDPYQLKRTAQSLKADNQDFPINVYEFIQQGKRSIADKALLDRMNTSDIILQEDSLTVRHLKNADMKVIDSGKVRIVKRAGPSGGPIDLGVCLSMATYVAVSEREKFPQPVVFDSDSGGDSRQHGSANNEVEERLPGDRSLEQLPKDVYESWRERNTEYDPRQPMSRDLPRRG